MTIGIKQYSTGPKIYIDNLTVEEWSAKVGLNPRTVYQHMSKGFCSLKKHKHFKRRYKAYMKRRDNDNQI